MNTINLHSRNVSLDIAKSICIILMVAGHSGCPKYIHDVIYLFHMPAFFLISGMLLSEKYLLDLRNGIKKKFKSYYIPYVKWSIVFILAHNILFYMHFYENEYTLKETLLYIVYAAIMMKTETLLGGYWFLSSLTWASIASVVFVYILNKYKKLNNRNLIGGAIISLLLATFEAVFLDRYAQIKIPSQFDPHTVMAFSFFIFGYVLRRLNFLGRRYPLPLWVLFLIPATIAFFVSWSMDTAKEWTFAYFAIALCGTFGLLDISRQIAKTKVAGFFKYLGDKTLYILTFHFLCFKAAAWCYLYFTNGSIEHLSEFPHMETGEWWMWIVYLIVGIALPLGIWELFHRIPILKKYA